MSRLLDAMGRVMLDASGRIILVDGTGPCCYKQSRLCSDDSLSGLWLALGDIPSSKTIVGGSTCYYFADGDTSYRCHGTLHTGYTTATGCDDSACGGGPAVCPTDIASCGSCPTSYGLTFANVSGGPFTSSVANSGGHCSGSSGSIGTGGYVATLVCTTSHTGSGANVWQLKIEEADTACTLYFEQPASSCPPTGSYTYVGGVFFPIDCRSGTPTASLS